MLRTIVFSLCTTKSKNTTSSLELNALNYQPTASFLHDAMPQETQEYGSKPKQK